MCCCSPEVRARKQARNQARKAAFMKPFSNRTGSSCASGSKIHALVSYPDTCGPPQYGTIGSVDELQQPTDVLSLVSEKGDEKARLSMRAPPSYAEAVSEEKIGEKDEKVGL
ncbi:MAG: hypothetical protein LQ340_004627 [Diploschistes diacapsis]|nr:MAG: hypothetical protein LQ340_004627 [Diploschistes diacapsis]